MWLFGRQSADTRLQDRLAAIEQHMTTDRARVEELERNQKDIALEWEETYGKVRRVLARINRANAKTEQEEGEEKAPPRIPPHNGGMSVFDAKARLGLG